MRAEPAAEGPGDETRESTSYRLGHLVGREARKWSGALLWGVLVGGTALPIFPASWIGVAIGGLQIGLIGHLDPRPKKQAGASYGHARITGEGKASPNTKLAVLGAVTGLAVLAAAANIEPNVVITGAVLFAASKAAVSRPLNIAGVAVALSLFLSSSWLLDPLLLVTSGSSITLGHAMRDIVRFLLLLAVMVGARIEQGEREEAKARAAKAEADLAVAAEAERSRIARDLHDVVAHHVSVMTLQAEAAKTVLPAGPETDDARSAVQRAIDAGRDAMGELRRLLGLLRATGEDDGAGLRPQPGIAEIETLAEAMSDNGLRTSVSRTGAVRPVPAGVALSAYRVVQEALTNSLKHSSATNADVAVEYSADAVRIVVTDDGHGGRRPTSAVGTGNGLAGMQERIALVEGSLSFGPVDGNGWRVEAVLPTT